MFLPCPQCGFLVALIAPRGNAAQRCPRCGHPLPRPDELDQAPAVVPASRRPAVPDVDGAEPLRPAEPIGHVPADDVAAPRPAPGEGVRVDAGPAAMEDAAHADPRDAPPPGDRWTRPPTASGSEESVGPDLDAAPGRLRVPAHVDAGALPSPASTGSTPTLAFPLHDDMAAAAMADAVSHRREPAAPGARRSPSFARRARARARHAGRRWPMYLAIAALALALALQLLLAQRRELAADPQWRPWVESTCRLLRCDVPAWHQPTAFTMLDRTVRPRAGAPGVLAVRARFRNDAPWPQAWPVVVLSLSDVEGRVLGARAFDPREYAPATRPATLAPGQSGTLTLDVVEPAPGVVAFGFDFR